MSVRIIVASENPVKLRASKDGFKNMFKEEIIVSGISVPSGVSEQPSTEEETIKGARTRAMNAKNKNSDADFWVGLEGGIEDKGDEMHAFAWCVVVDKKGKIGKGKTATFILPKSVAELIKKGHELGEADDIVFSRTNSKQDNGAVGILTGNVVTRTNHYEKAVILALIPFKNPDLY